MHIVLSVLAAIGVIAFYIIRANQVNRAGRELADTASEVKGLVRRSFWRRKSEVDPVTQVEDPRLAAAAMMCALARCDGDVTERQRDVMLEQMQSGFNVGRQEAEDMFAQGRWLSGEIKDLNAFLRRASGAVQSHCNEPEKRDLIAMLETVARVEGEPNDHQLDGIRYLGERLGLEPDRPSLA